MSNGGKNPGPQNAGDCASRPRALLRRADQACVGFVVAVSLAAIAGMWLYQSRRDGGLIDIERDPTHESYSFQIDINEANWPEFTLLPDVGEVLARRIVESREVEGPFADHDDLTRVKGIGPKTLQKIRPYLRPIPNAQAIAESGK